MHQKLCFQFASFVTDKTSTHGGRWFSALSSHPWIQAIFFLIFFILQINLFVIFVQKIFFNGKADIKTSLEYASITDFRYPRMTICSSALYNKTALESKFSKILAVIFVREETSTSRISIWTDFDQFNRRPQN